MNRSLLQADPEVAQALADELKRQQETLVMIPSENYASKAVLQAQGSVLTNKYAEGYPGARWYHGCESADRVESLAIERAKTLFGADHANVQPHTGSQSNMSAYFALLEPGDTILTMQLNQGGHLTHGHRANFSGKYYRVVHYPLDRATEMIDYDAARKLAHEHKPKLIVVGASAYPRTIDFSAWRAIADEVGALLMADIAHVVGLIAAGCHPDPVPYCDIVTSTTHKTLRGPRGAFIMCKGQYADAIDRAVFPGIQAGPLMHIIAAKAVAFKEASSPEFGEYQRQIIRNALVLAETLTSEGFRLVSGGTDNHLMLVDVRELGITGQDAANLLAEAGIIVNKNSIPYDTQPPALGGGFRPGTPALTTRGMMEPEMKQIGLMISRTLHHREDAAVRAQVHEEVLDLCRRFPIYPDLEQW